MTKVFNTMMMTAVLAMGGVAANAQGLPGGSIGSSLGASAGVAVQAPGVAVGTGIGSNTAIQGNTGAGVTVGTQNHTTTNSRTQNHTTTNSTTNNADSATGTGLGTGAMNSMSTEAGASLSVAQVTQAQERLIDKGYTLSADGVVGVQTENAIRAFQRDNNLAVTGDLDAQTMSELSIESGANR